MFFWRACVLHFYHSHTGNSLCSTLPVSQGTCCSHDWTSLLPGNRLKTFCCVFLAEGFGLLLFSYFCVKAPQEVFWVSFFPVVCVNSLIGASIFVSWWISRFWLWVLSCPFWRRSVAKYALSRALQQSGRLSMDYLCARRPCNKGKVCALLVFVEWKWASFSWQESVQLKTSKILQYKLE